MNNQQLPEQQPHPHPQDSYYYYEDVIDLRELVKTLWDFKWLIIATVILAAAAAYLTAKFVLDPQYESSAHIGIRRPAFQANLEPSILNLSSVEEYQILRDLSVGYQEFRDLAETLPELAEADDVWMSVCLQMGIQCGGEGSVKPELETELVGTNQLKLTVTYENPDQAVEFANVWAAEVIHRWNELYGNENVNLSQLEKGVERARNKWVETQGALEAYLPLSKIDVVQVQLSQSKNKLNRYLDEVEENERLIRDIQSLDRRLAELDQRGVLSLGEALSIIALQQRSAGGISGTQFQLPGVDVLGEDYPVSEARENLDALIRALMDQNQTLIAKTEKVELEITDLSVKLEAEQAEIDQLKMKRDRARQQYSALVGYLEGTRINLLYQKQAAYSIGRTVVPQEKSGQSTIVIVALAGIIAGMIAVGGVFIYSWWTDDEEYE